MEYDFSFGVSALLFVAAKKQLLKKHEYFLLGRETDFA